MVVAKSQMKRDFNVSGTGFANVEIAAEFQFVSILNSSPSNIEVYRDTRSLNDSEPLEAWATLTPFQNLTLPLDSSRYYTFIWQDSGSSQVEKLSAIFSVENLNINFQGLNPTADTNVNLIVDGIGLVKQTQLPAALTAGGNLKVEVLNTAPVVITGEVEIKNDAGGNLPVVVATALPAGNNNIGNVDVTTLPALPAGANAIGTVGVTTLPALPSGTNNIGKVDINSFPGGLSFVHNSAATTNATVVRNSAGDMYSITASNIAASPRFLKIYAKSSVPTVGTDTPIITVTIPAMDTVNVDFSVLGVHFSPGISIAITGAAVDTDTTAIGAGEVKVLISHK